MENSNNTFLAAKAAIAAVCGAFTAAFGWLGWLVVAWAVCMVLDWLSGSAAAARRGEWSSAVARAGIWHKAGMLVVVVVAALKQAGAVQIATGSYVGTGTYGADHPCSLTFDFSPKLVVVQQTQARGGWGGDSGAGFLWQNGQISQEVSLNGPKSDTEADLRFNIEELQFSWYSNNSSSGAMFQENLQGVTYVYIAFS